MLITLTCRAPNAPDIGFLLAKNPASVLERPFSAGTVWVFNPEVADDHLTVALLVEVDPIGLVRGRAALAGLDQYVNDRPYVASSLFSVAIANAFSTAMSGHSRERPERVEERIRWEVALPVVACDGGEVLIRALFAPLGYEADVRRLALDDHFPAWGQSDLYGVRLVGAQTTRDVLTHLYVLLPVLDNAKHYHVGAEEADKLLNRGGDWLRAHPARDLIARRYLRYRRPLVVSTLAALADGDLPESERALEDAPADAPVDLGDVVGSPVGGGNATGEEVADRPVLSALPTDDGAERESPHALRLAAVMDAVRAVGGGSWWISGAVRGVCSRSR